MSITRIYVVKQKGSGDTQRLIDATSAAAAIRYCARNLYEAKAAGPRDIADLMAGGQRIERANEEATQTKQDDN